MDKQTLKTETGKRGTTQILIRAGNAKKDESGKTSRLLRATMALTLASPLAIQTRGAYAGDGNSSSTQQSSSNVVSLESIFDFHVGGTYDPSVVTQISNVPLSIRNVAPFPSDASFSTPGPIPNDAMRPSLDLVDYISADIAPKVDIGPVFIKGGLGVDLASECGSQGNLPGGNDIAEYNYTNAPGTSQRGYGAALTYMTASTSFWPTTTDQVRPYVFVEGGINFGDGGFISGGCKLYQEDVLVQTGWDRYNALSQNANYKIASLEVIEPYVNFDVVLGKADSGSGKAALDLTVGYSDVASKKFSAIGEGTQISVRPAVDVGLMLTFRF